MVLKKLTRCILFITGIVPFLKCSSGYQEKDGKMLFNGREITDKNFIVLNDAFAHDSLYAYYKEKTIRGADVASFKPLDNHYAKDSKHVYYCDEFRDGQSYYMDKKQTIRVIEGALAASFVMLEKQYAKDSLHAFYGGKLFAVKDIASFKPIDSYFSADTVQVYFNCRPLSGSDSKTFLVLNGNYAKDKNHTYFYGNPGEAAAGIYRLPGITNDFKILDYPFSSSSTTVFFEQWPVAHADPSSFTVIKNGYAKDTAGVYFQTKKIAGADAGSFEVFKENDELTEDFYYAKDKAAIYWQDKKLLTPNMAAFRVLGHGYGSDGKNIFYKTGIIKNADPGTYKVYPHDFGDADAEDASGKYHEGQKLINE